MNSLRENTEKYLRLPFTPTLCINITQCIEVNEREKYELGPPEANNVNSDGGIGCIFTNPKCVQIHMYGTNLLGISDTYLEPVFPLIFTLISLTQNYVCKNVMIARMVQVFSLFFFFDRKCKHKIDCKFKSTFIFMFQSNTISTYSWINSRLWWIILLLPQPSKCSTLLI